MEARQSLVARLTLVAFLAAMALDSQGCGDAGVGEAPRPANLLLIVLDTVRADHLGCYGHERPTSPAIDAFAADAIRFERAYAPSPWTKPSVASIFTGLRPRTHRVTGFGSRLAPRCETLAEMFAGRGFATGAVVSNVLIGRPWNFHQGFERFSQHEAKGPQHFSAEGVTDRAIEMLGELAGEQPFFLFVHYYDPHYAYLRHPEYGFAPARAPRVNGPPKKLAALDPASKRARFLPIVYDEEIRFTDDGVGRLLAGLRERGLAEETLVVLTSDHGEEFFEHGNLGHLSALNEQQLRVPLIVRPPHFVGPPRVVADPVSITALPATILEILGVEGESDGFEVGSLTPLIDGTGAAEPVYVELDFVPSAPLGKPRPEPRARLRGVIGPRYKLIHDGLSDDYALYDLATDPSERSNALEREPEVARALRQDLDSALPASAWKTAGRAEAKLSERQVEQLKALGYLDP